MFPFYDRIKETSTTTGTGTLTLAGAVTGFRAFSVGGNGKQWPYTIEHSTADEWEVGLGTWSTGGTLSRDTVHASSNSDNLVDFSAGTKIVGGGMTAYVANNKGSFQVDGMISAAVTADQDDWNPTGLSAASWILATPDAARAITGLAGGRAGRFVGIVNGSGTYSLTITSGSSSSSVGNRILNSLDTSLIIAPYGGCLLLYDAVNSFWRTVGAWSSFNYSLDLLKYSGVGTVTHGDIIYRGSAQWHRLAPGTSGYLLGTQGSGNPPVWTAPVTQYTDTLAKAAIGAYVLDHAGVLLDIGKSLTSEETIYTYTVPGGTLGTDKALHLRLSCEYLNTSGGNRNLTLRAKFGATTMFGDLQLMGSSATRRGLVIDLILSANAATNAQRLAGFSTLSTGGSGSVAGYGALTGMNHGSWHGTAAEDSTADKALAVTCQHSTGGTTLLIDRFDAKLTLIS